MHHGRVQTLGPNQTCRRPDPDRSHETLQEPPSGSSNSSSQVPKPPGATTKPMHWRVRRGVTVGFGGFGGFGVCSMPSWESPLEWLEWSPKTRDRSI